MLGGYALCLNMMARLWRRCALLLCLRIGPAQRVLMGLFWRIETILSSSLFSDTTLFMIVCCCLPVLTSCANICQDKTSLWCSGRLRSDNEEIDPAKVLMGLNFSGNLYKKLGEGGPIIGHEYLDILDRERPPITWYVSDGRLCCTADHG